VDILLVQLIFWDWIEFAIRWLHVITAIAWIGSSFYFIALDLGLRDAPNLPYGVKGEEWQVHGGGFYNIRKFLVAPPNLPENLIWFKWESYITWLSGFALLAVVYYGGAELLLIDTAVLDISANLAIFISLFSLLFGWMLYDWICKSKIGNDDNWLMIILFFILVVISYLYCNIFSGRAAFLHLGAFTATLMSGNVFFIIIPNQKIVVSDLIAGKDPDPKYGKIAKQRSTHNNYLTLPVIFMMISNHYPISFGAQYNWVIAALIFLMGVSIRYYFNSTHARNKKPLWAWAVTFILFFFAIIVSFIRPILQDVELEANLRNNAVPHYNSIDFVEVRDTVVSRCTMCHAREPLWDGFSQAPGGVLLESDYEIANQARQIYFNSVLSHYMPPNNISYMETSERRLIKKWFEEVYRE
jgi:uncharacterized membrane protein